jgi:hypothetical protein
MSHWHSGPDREEDLRHSDPMSREEIDDLWHFHRRERERELRRMNWTLALMAAFVLVAFVALAWGFFYG